jgi:serine protease AprX
MTDALRIRLGVRQIFLMAAAAILAFLATFALRTAAPDLTPNTPAAPAAATPAADKVGESLATLASDRPARKVEAIVQFQPDVAPKAARGAIQSVAGTVTGDLHVINGLAAELKARDAVELARDKRVRAVSLNAVVKKNAAKAVAGLATSYNEAIQSPFAWTHSYTGKGVGVAVIDTGIQGDLPDFRVSQSDSTSRVVATATVNPDATSDDDGYGHGTHVAGIIAGNGRNRSSSDPLHGKYVGVAPDADLISVKVSDEHGDTTVLDVIYGLQFVVDFKDDYGIRVVNLSLESTEAESYKTDPLDAAVEAAWFKGVVVVAAAGNRGDSDDAVSYAPGNDPYVISVGAVDDQGTKGNGDDALASWSSRGETQDGYSKPELVAPGARIVSTLAPGSDFTSMCATCVVDGEYIRAGGTSMAAPMVAGAVANLLQAQPNLTPDQVKGILLRKNRGIDGYKGLSLAGITQANAGNVSSNEGLTPNELVDPATGEIDYARSRWSRSRWSRSRWSRSRWSHVAWTCDCYSEEEESVDPTRSRWSRSRWSRSRWSRSRWSWSFTK